MMQYVLQYKGFKNKSGSYITILTVSKITSIAKEVPYLVSFREDLI